MARVGISTAPFVTLGVIALLAGQALAADGAALYKRFCQLCHQPDGKGVPGQFPRLKGRAAEIAALPGGREYLIAVVAFGLRGKIEVDGRPINGIMPPVPQVKDEDLAAVLNHLVQGPDPATAPVDFQPFTLEEVAAVRGGDKRAPNAVYEMRQRIGVQ